MINEWIGLALTLTAIAFFIGGSVGLLRFPDFYTRLHALTKADNLGLGFVVIGAMVQADSWTVALKLLLIWVLVLVSSSTAAYVMAKSELSKGAIPWSKI
jgi:multicomponent Na+:H+ antiporter subunit G